MSGSIIYTYVNGNPVNFTDPMGLAGQCGVGNAVSTAWKGFTSILPGGAAMQSAKENFDAGNYGWAGALGVAAIGEAALTVATGGGSMAVKAGAGELVSLYRAVGPVELADINALNRFRNLGSAEGKYFTTSAESASAYAQQAVKAFGDPAYTIVETRVQSSILNGLSPATVDRGITAWVIPNSQLQGLTPNVLKIMPLP